MLAYLFFDILGVVIVLDLWFSVDDVRVSHHDSDCVPLAGNGFGPLNEVLRLRWVGLFIWGSVWQGSFGLEFQQDGQGFSDETLGIQIMSRAQICNCITHGKFFRLVFAMYCAS